jgi:hypothetical protein
MARIEELEADLRKMALDYLAAQGQAAEAYQAQLAAEHKLAKALVAVNYFFLRDPDKPTHWEYSRNRAEELARTAIAELKGEDRR